MCLADTARNPAINFKLIAKQKEFWIYDMLVIQLIFIKGY